MEAIYAAVLAGAAGGAVGIGVVWVLSRILKSPPRWLSLIPVFFALLVVSLTRSAHPSASDPPIVAVDMIPTGQALKSHYPEDYAKLERAVARARTGDEVVQALDGTATAVLGRQRALANEQSSYAMYEVARDEGRALREVDAGDCAAFMDGHGSNEALAKALTPALMAKERGATAQLLTQAAVAPAPPAKAMALDELVKLSSEAVSTLPVAEQDVAIRVLREARDPRTPEEQRATCDFNLALADVILSRPRVAAGRLVRALWAMQ
jgi:hypothetical protein